MKKHLTAIAGVCAAMVFSSCENLNEDLGIGGAKEVTIHASVAEQPVDTKSAIDDFGSEKVTFKWLAGDAISVFFGDSEGSIFVTDVTASKAKFKGTIGAVMGGGDDLTDETSLWGVYPYDKNTSCDGSSITLTLPNEQGAVAETFADDLFPSIARSTNFTMAFYPVCGSIRFKVSDPEIVKVTLSGNNGEELAGKATVSMPLGGAPAVDVISEGQKELVMKAADGGCFDTSKYYYFVMYPTDFTKGLTITYYKEDEKASYVLNSSVKLGRNRFMSATNKDAGLTFTPSQGDEDISGDDEELVIPVSSVTLSSSTLKLYEGDKAILTAKVMPTDATNPKVTWSSDAPEVAYVDQNGEVTAISEGPARITATADGVSATCMVVVSSLMVATADYVDEFGKNHGKGVAVGGAIWAPVNCGYHETDYPYGKLYQWGRKYGQGYDGDAAYPTVEDGTIKEGGVSLAGGQSQANKDVFFLGYADNNYDWVYPSDDKLWNSGTEGNPVKTDNDPCPDGWRVPTYNEFVELSANYSEWTEDDKGQSGYWFSGASTYADDVPQIFLPAAGDRYYTKDGVTYARGRNGYYWSSSTDDRRYAYSVNFSNSGVDRNYIQFRRANGYSVRCVQSTTPTNSTVGGNYESNISWTLGNKAYDSTSGGNAQYGVVNGVEVNEMLKLGTSTAVGDAILHVPAGTKRLGFYCIAWKSKTAQVKFSIGDTRIQTIEVEPNDGAWGNPPYEIAVTYFDYYEVNIPSDNAVDIKVETLNSDNRALFIGIRAISE